MTKEITDAFGLQADSLELVVDDEHPDRLEHCQSCVSWAKKYAELEAVFYARTEFTRIAPQTLWENQDFCV